MHSCPINASLSLSEAADWAQVAIALFNLLLAFYLLIYQRAKDREQVRRDVEKDREQRIRDQKADHATALINEQNIKLQWFKELVVAPNFHVIDTFYNNLSTLRSKITSNDLPIAEREALNAYIKAELATIRKSFVDVLMQVDSKFGSAVMGNLDSLVDGITEAIFNDELKLALPAVYEKNIGSKISYSRNNLIALLYNYKGISEK